MNMWKKSSLIILLFWSLSSAAMDSFGDYSPPKKRTIQLTKTGPYFGLQQGRYLVPEIGFERQWSKLKLVKTETHALHAGFNYNFKYKVLGYDMGYWYRLNRIGITYGANICLRSDFEQTRFGIVPIIGYKIWQIHVQTGYHFLTSSESPMETNRLFISARFVLINNRDMDVKGGKKRKKLFD